MTPHQQIGEKGATQLVGLLAQLVREHGQYGAAAQLGVSDRTLRRAIHVQRLSSKLRLALERYLLLQQNADVPGSPLIARIDALESRLVAVERAVGHTMAPFDGNRPPKRRSHWTVALHLQRTPAGRDQDTRRHRWRLRARRVFTLGLWKS